MSPIPATIAGFLTSTSIPRAVSSPLEPEANLIALPVFLVDEELSLQLPHDTRSPNKHGGLIVGVVFAVIAAVFGGFLVFSGAVRTLGGAGAMVKGVMGNAGAMGQGGAPTTKEGMGMGAVGMGMPIPTPMPAPSERDAVELASYPLPTLPPSSSSYFPPSSSSNLSPPPTRLSYPQYTPPPARGPPLLWLWHQRITLLRLCTQR
ncbi:hypothetical protein C8R45DRAFT_942466 [Mycena sanguinolenta]|nr:hypothetical protein C8R45DRAFT_942466 [Mycena sanguinolenta]